MTYTLTDKDNQGRLFYASISSDVCFIMYDKKVVCCGNGFTFNQSINLINIHHSKFSTGQLTDIEECGQPK